MENSSKTKEALVSELQDLRAKLAAFEQGVIKSDKKNQSEEQERRIKHLLSAMHKVNRLTMQENDPKRLIRQGCEYLTDTLGYFNAWIVLLDEAGAVKATAACGCEKEFENLKKQLKNRKFPRCMKEALENRGTILVRENHADCCIDCPVTCKYEDRIGMAARIYYGDRVYGILVASMPREFGDNQEERNLFAELALDLGFALYKIEAQEMHREQESLLAAVYQNTPLIMILLDGYHRVRRINGLACEYLGRPASEMLGKPCGEVLRCLHNQNDPKGCGNGLFCAKCNVRLTVMDTMETGLNHHHVEASLPFEIQGEEKNLTILLYTTRLQFQKQAMVLVTILDISERKRSELALKESEQLFRSLIEGAPDAVFVQTENRFAYLNNSSVLLFGGESADQLIGRKLTEFFHADYHQALTDHIRTLVMLQKPFHSVDQVCLRLDGSQVPVELSAVPIIFHGKKSALVFVRDITERKKMEEQRWSLEQQFRQTQRLESLGVLAGGIAHDFNNILMIVMGHAELALEKMSPVSTARENVREIIKASHRAADLCRQMLAYAGKAPSSLEKNDLSELIGEMAQMIKNSISNKTVLKLDLCHRLPPIHADLGQIRQIVMNLIINASEAIGDQNGIITIKTGAAEYDKDYLCKTALDDQLVPGMYVYLEVHDTGCGIENDQKDRIFDPFYSTKFTGRGLGLAAVMGIVRAHKGALHVFSDPGKGTTLKVLLPAMENNGENAGTQKNSEICGASNWSGSGTVLLVDDEKSLRVVGTKMLETLGFNVLNASDGFEAVEVYRQRQKDIDLVLLDLTMPRMDGAEAFAKMCRLNPDIRVVLASGYSEKDVSLRFEGKGLAGVLQKPYTLSKLRELLAGIIHEC
jgi:PAS domain S-box-containing protein